MIKQFLAQIQRIEDNTETILRRLHRMSIDEAGFNAALGEFVQTLDSTLAAIKEKLDSLEEAGSVADFTDEFATIEAAKQRLETFVSENLGSGNEDVPEDGEDEGIPEPPVEA